MLVQQEGVVCSAQGQAGERKKEPPSPVTRREVPGSHERTLFLGCFHRATNDKGSRYFPAVLRAEGLWGSWDEKVEPVHSKEKNPMASALHLSHSPTPHAHRDACPQLRTQGEYGEPGSGDVTKCTLWVWLRKLVHKDKRKD